MIITISGTPGSGKSTVAKLVAEKLGFPRHSSGDFQRELAKERSITIQELGELEATDPTLDFQVDKRQKELGKTEDNFVMDTWLGANFIPHSIKVFLTASEETRARRIFNDRTNKIRMDSERLETQEATKESMRSRDKVNIARWKEYYNFDYTDTKHYDLVIDTASISAEEVAEKIINFIKAYKSKQNQRKK